MKRGVLFLAAAVVTVAASKDARADEVYELKKDVPVDIAFTGTTLALITFSEVAKADLVPRHARWSDVNPPDEAARNLLRWESPKTAATISDFLLLLAVPGTAFGTLGYAGIYDNASHAVPTDALLLLEAVAVNGLVNQVVKYTVARERPYGHFPTPLDPVPTAEARVSFYSGHTSTAFAFAAAAGTIASLRDYELAPLAWAPGAALASLIGVLRISADKHYLTDVLSGAAAGTAIGILVPFVFHGRREPVPTTTAPPPATSQGLSFGGSF